MTTPQPIPQAPFSPPLPDFTTLGGEWVWDWPSAHGGTTWGSRGCLRTIRPGLTTIYWVTGVWEEWPGGPQSHPPLVPASIIAQLTAKVTVNKTTGAHTYGENLLDWDHFEYVYVPYPGSLYPLGGSTADGVDRLTAMINAIPGKFILAGGSAGGAVLSNVYDDIRSGSLSSRDSDLVMGWVVGNLRRQAGRSFPSGPLYCPDGAGCYDPLTGTETRWWEWSCTAGTYPAYDQLDGVTYSTTDPFSCLSTDEDDDAAVAVRSLVAETMAAMAFEKTQLQGLYAELMSNSLIQAGFNLLASPHGNSHYTVQPFLESGDHRTYWEYSYDHINSLAAAAPAPTRRLLEFPDRYTVQSGDILTAGSSAQWINLEGCTGPTIIIGINFYDADDTLISTATSWRDTDGTLLISATAPQTTVTDPIADTTWRGMQANIQVPGGAVTAALVWDVEPQAQQQGIVWLCEPVFGSRWASPEIVELDRLNQELWYGDALSAAGAADELAKLATPDPEWTICVYDKFWRRIAQVGDYIEATGSDPTNNVPTATLVLKGGDPLIRVFQECRTTMIGVTMETAGQRFAFYCDTFEYVFEDGVWKGTANLVGIWDVLNYLMVWPVWFLPIQTQLLSHAIYFGPICSCLRVLIWEQAMRIQVGFNDLLNNMLSLNLDFRSWFATWILSNFNIVEMLKCPIYVSLASEPPIIAPIVSGLMDTSPLICRTVRMESAGAVIRDMTKAYGVDVRVDLWLPGDEQPDMWTRMSPLMALDQPTYVVTVTDRTQITSPTHTILDSIIRTVVDLGESMMGGLLDPILNPNPPPGLPQGFHIAPKLGISWVPPWVLLIAPEPGEKGSIETCKIVDHTPKGWQHIIGGRSPKWLNDLFNVLFSWMIDAVSILIGFTGIPSDLLEGFMQNAILAFQLWANFDRRVAVGPYHPAIEVFHSTSSAPYNIETLFSFINAYWDSRGWTCVQATFRNGEVYTLGRDIFRGGLISIAYNNRQTLYTDFVENVFWRVDKDHRDLMVQVGDGKSIESPLAKHQRFISGILEAINVVTLAPESGGLI